MSVAGPQRILYLIETGGLGGAEENLVQLTSQLRRDHYHPCVRLVKDGWLRGALERRAMDVRLLRTRDVRLRLNLPLILELTCTVKRERIALVHAYMFAMGLHGFIASLLARVPVVISVRGQHYEFATRRRRRLCHLMARFGCRFTAASRDIAARLASQCGVPDSRITVVPNGVDTALYFSRMSRPEARRRSGLSTQLFTIGTVARLEKVKGIAYLLRALPYLEHRVGPVQVAIAGDGPQRTALQRMAALVRGDSRVVFLGLCRDVVQVLAALDVFVLPSVSEGMSNALLQAMAMRRPCVATEVGGSKEVLSHRQTGLLVPPADAKALARAVASLAESPRLRSALSGAARAEVEARYTVDQMVSLNEALYANLLAGGRCAARTRAGEAIASADRRVTNW